MNEYTIDEASRLSGITVRSLRNYVHQYQEHLSLKRGAYNALLFDDASLETLVKIKALLRDGKTRRQICEILEKEKEEPTIQVTRNAVTAQAPEAPVILPLLKKVDTVLTKLADDNRRLQERLNELEARMIGELAGSSLTREPSSGQPATLTLPVPQFILSVRDGCIAIARSLWTTFFSGRDR